MAVAVVGGFCYLVTRSKCVCFGVVKLVVGLGEQHCSLVEKSGVVIVDVQLGAELGCIGWLGWLGCGWWCSGFCFVLCWVIGCCCCAF